MCQWCILRFCNEKAKRLITNHLAFLLVTPVDSDS